MYHGIQVQSDYWVLLSLSAFKHEKLKVEYILKFWVGYLNVDSFCHFRPQEKLSCARGVSRMSSPRIKGMTKLGAWDP